MYLVAGQARTKSRSLAKPYIEEEAAIVMRKKKKRFSKCRCGFLMRMAAERPGGGSTRLPKVEGSSGKS